MKMQKMTMKITVWLLLFGISGTFTAAAGPGSCAGRCGEVFARGQWCTCDFSCLRHNDCCQDFEAICTTDQSCRGRCAETFRRGRLCECDAQCANYNTCCWDYKLQCGVRMSVSSSGSFHHVKNTASGKQKSQGSKQGSNSESEEWYQGASNIRLTQLLSSSPSFSSEASDFPGHSSSLLSHNAPSAGRSAPRGALGGNLNVQVVLSDGEAALSSQGVSAAGFRPKPNPLQDVAQVSGAFVLEGPAAGVVIQSDLCSDAPISGLTALSNGTVLIFKGEVFWSVDPVSHLAGRPQSIRDILGVSGPIDTVFTRCNCHGKTYIIKGNQYWRLDGNMVMEPGFPRPLVSEFLGLSGGISAALAVPATRSRQEMVYFFKHGDIMQKFTFSSESTLACGKTPNSMKRRPSRQPDGYLSKEINIKVSLKEIPTPVTSALSMPNPQRTDRYEYYIFSGPLFFSVDISGDLLTLAKPDPLAVFAASPILSSAVLGTNSFHSVKPAHPVNSIRHWLWCA
ncbi:proteoglycan 4a [Thalassophryne amazonica]|uniref:proteoglycan 4a n=1 Tax=Thalassophryne amazonica TaxID=390379 RepID=UPI0014711165|nr:proteoglycan 4a [Thalassophryne amazonica]